MLLKKVSSQIYMSDGGIEVEDADVLSPGEECHTMSMFKNVGWALPVRSSFRFSSKQNKVLYDRAPTTIFLKIIGFMGFGN